MKMNQRMKLGATGLLMVLSVGQITAQSMLLGWDFDSMLGANGAANGTVGGTAATAAPSTFNAPNVAPSTFNIGAGALGAINSAPGAYRTRGWESANVAAAIENNDYFTFTVAATSGTLDLGRVDIWGNSASGGHTLDVRSSLDGFASSLGTKVLPIITTINAAELGSFTLGAEFSGISSVEFRVYVFNANPDPSIFQHNAVGNLNTVDTQFDVGVYAVPEPSTYAALAGVLALGLVVYRRRRA
jgi:hypothetical protein